MIKIKPDTVTPTVTRVTKVTVTKGVVTKLLTGRPRKHGAAAERQKAYRSRKKAVA